MFQPLLTSLLLFVFIYFLEIQEVEFLHSSHLLSKGNLLFFDHAIDTNFPLSARLYIFESSPSNFIDTLNISLSSFLFGPGLAVPDKYFGLLKKKFFFLSWTLLLNLKIEF